MKRTLVLLGSVLLCGFLSGCTSDPQGDAVNSVIQQMGAAAGDIDNITIEVDKAIKKHEKDQAPLDLTEATKTVKKLEDTGRNEQAVKVKMVDHAKVVDKEEKQELERRFKSQIAREFERLLEAKKKLNDALQQAEAIDRDKVEELRRAISQAEGPFQALARQS